MRIETVSRELFTYDELDDKAKAAARDWYREASAGDTFWSDSIVEVFAEMVAPAFGWEVRTRSEACRRWNAEGNSWQPGTTQVPCVYWSGFWSHGDGAQFEGDWSADRVSLAALRADRHTDARLHALADRMEAFAAGRMVDYDDEPMRATVRASGHYSHSGCTRFESDTETDGALDELTDITRDLMDWLYYALESEYEYQNGDEAVAETIRANEYEFTKDGERA